SAAQTTTSARPSAWAVLTIRARSCSRAASLTETTPNFITSMIVLLTTNAEEWLFVASYEAMALQIDHGRPTRKRDTQHSCTRRGGAAVFWSRLGKLYQLWRKKSPAEREVCRAQAAQERHLPPAAASAQR